MTRPLALTLGLSGLLLGGVALTGAGIIGNDPGPLVMMIGAFVTSLVPFAIAWHRPALAAAPAA
jgi:hypothetical protein